MAGSNTLVITEGNFEAEVAKAGVPVLVDFWATWCGPCQMIAPTIDELATELSGKAKVGKVDVDQNPGLASQFNVQSIPTVIVFKNGKPVQTMVGAKHKRDYIAALNAASAG
jgi:thioredoxin 1